MNKIILDGHKLGWHRERVEAWQRGERIAPITIDCALTRACSYRCSYCYGQLQENDSKPITRDVIFRFLDDTAEIGVKGISFVSDGESTCSPHLYDAILKGKANGLDMALGTNGYLLDDDRLPEILPALTYLRFNISAAEPLRYAAIHGSPAGAFEKVISTIRRSVALKRELNMPVTLGLQMVLLPEFSDQILPLARLGKELGVDYVVIKHCSDDENSSIGIDYEKYHALEPLLKEAEEFSDEVCQISVKWSKILSGGNRKYSRCYAPPFIIQLSGSGLVAPCGMFFNTSYKKYHIGNIAETSFKDIWQSERYWEVMNLIASDCFDAKTMCGSLCLQHKVNEYLWDLRQDGGELSVPLRLPPAHLNFI
ncbi:MAG: radical SAM protein [Desulfuromonadaceae bacterium]|nr:radical SAM protein [Desulfuromonadaceae bacterium]MDD2854327.1 radical SAM protein [Desulfuromonadaceae bacterium]